MNKFKDPKIVVWACYTLITGACLLLTAMAVSNALGFGALAGIVAGMVILPLMGLLVRAIHVIMGRQNLPGRNSRGRKGLIALEGFLLAGAFIGMVILRLALPWNVTGDTAFGLAEVTSGDFRPVMAHKGYELYLYLLHGIFLLLGNKASAAILLQMILLTGAVFSLYFGVRRLSGPVAALTVTAFLGFSPFMVSETAKLLPLLLFLTFYGMAMGGITALPGRMRGLYKISDRILAVVCYSLVGLLTGFVCYLDVVGITLLIFLTGVICCDRREPVVAGTRRGMPEGIVSPEAYLEAMEQEPAILGSEVFVFVCCLVMTVLGYVAAHGIRSLGGGSVTASIYGQLELYMPGRFQIPTVVGAGTIFWDVPALAVLMALGIFGFWHSGRIRDKAMWLAAAALLAGMQCTGMTSEAYSDGFAILYLFCAAVAGCSLADLPVVQGACVEAEEEGTGNLDIIDMDVQGSLDMESQDKLEILNNSDTNTGEGGAYGNVQDDAHNGVQADAAPVINYIENPLPLPKKHKPRVLDYDYEVAEDDDFDLK